MIKRSEHETGFQIKGSVLEFDLFYDLHEVISFVANVSASTAEYFWEMPLFNRQSALTCDVI